MSLVKQKGEKDAKPQVFFQCDPGYAAFDGDDHIICTSDGTWLRYGTQILATPFRCCLHSDNYCPPIDLTQNPGAALIATGYELLAECADAPVAGPDPNTVDYVGCEALSLEPHVQVDLCLGQPKQCWFSSAEVRLITILWWFITGESTIGGQSLAIITQC
eukprot:Skav216839  [mRNA]  locus=scaffold989:108935:118521:+ [translate_table: standard]